MGVILDLGGFVRFGDPPDFSWAVEHLADGTLDAPWRSLDESLSDKLFLLQELGRPRHAWERWGKPLADVVTALLRRETSRWGAAWAGETVRYFRRLVAAPENVWDALYEESARRLEEIRVTVARTPSLELAHQAARLVRGATDASDRFAERLTIPPDEQLETLLATAPAPKYEEILAAIEAR